MRPTRLQTHVFIALVALFFTGACGGGDGGSAAPTGPNFLFITIDTLRADRLGSYGSSVQTPAMDRLAAEGVRFAHAVTAAPTTLPSHASMFTGATPPRHGLRDNAAGILAPDAHTMAEAFQQAGFRTGAFVSAFVLDARWGLAQGFDAYNGPPVAPGQAPASPAEAERVGSETIAEAMAWLEDAGDEPWFAWVHLFDPHAPYAPPAEFLGRYPNAPYDGEVAFSDSLVGRLRAHLEALGVWDNTTVILTSDHGEALGEHGEPAHGFFLYEPTLRVPLIVHPAAADASAPRGVVVETPVALIDIFPTVIETWGLEPGVDNEGRSLVAAMRGEAIDVVPIYSETLLPNLYFGWHDLRAITHGDDKFIAAPNEELYDVVVDPGETDNRVAAEVARTDELREELLDWLERSESASIAVRSGADDPDRAAAIRSLGYLNVGGGGASLADPKDKIGVYAAMMAALGAWELGNVEQALSIIDEQIAADPEFAGAQHFRGLVLGGNGRYEEAAEAFERALEIDPEHALAGRELARAYRTIGDFEQSAVLLRDALLRQPGDYDLRWELADVLMRDGLWDEASVVIAEGLTLTPNAPKLHFGAGVVALQTGSPEQALTSFDLAAATAPELPNLQYQRGQAFEALGRTDEALSAYEAEAARQPGNYFALFGQARLMAVAGRPAEQLIDVLRAALVARPGAPEASLFLAQVLVDRGDAADLPEAEQLAAASVFNVQVPQLQAMGHATLAQIYEAQGRDDEAAQQRAAADRINGR